MFSVLSLTLAAASAIASIGLGDPLDAVFREFQLDSHGPEQFTVLADQRALGLRQDPDQLFLAQGLQLDSDRQAPLQLGNQVRRLGDVEGPGCDEQDVIRPDHAVLGVHQRAFDDGEHVALHALA